MSNKISLRELSIKAKTEGSPIILNASTTYMHAGSTCKAEAQLSINTDGSFELTGFKYWDGSAWKDISNATLNKKDIEDMFNISLFDK